MRDLALVGPSEDGRYLITRDPASGARFRLRVDRRLAATVERSTRDSHRSPGQLEIPMESSLSPRDIQTRIRRGESVEQVAEAAGTSVEQIMGFATPVIAEREHMVDQARATSVRRKHVSGTPVALGALVDEVLMGRGITPEDAAWDAWRREDGRWTVQVVLPDGQAAAFCFDHKSRYVLPDDVPARDLVGDLASEDSLDMAIADAIRGGDEVVAEDVEDTEKILDHAPVHSLKEARDRRALGQFEVEEPAENTDDRPAPAPRKKNARRSVPSWDEIMFGGKRGD
ncbi:septation protein SepH [uncultured Aeromicrobium sp.]|uniref:septation protein SepH n=1 Tax=uncultured Aeromicrobium sp. TaxID=337820 RepID=UPI0025E4AC46|nr:septation protein SepH [uncultured Aeromicrobium sp.]